MGNPIKKVLRERGIDYIYVKGQVVRAQDFGKHTNRRLRKHRPKETIRLVNSETHQEVVVNGFKEGTSR